MMNDARVQGWVDRIDTELVRYFSQKDLSCNPLDRAMEYTLLAGGKRLRPLLTLMVCDAFDAPVEPALPFALASEFLHTYSLIHDDLPCMDDDDMRRGKPANHVIFGDANAVLAGDALQAEAFHVLAVSPYVKLSAERRVALIAEFAEAVGRRGMVAGQVMDLSDEGRDIDLDRLKLLHRRKTGCLLRYGVRLGGYLAGLDDVAMSALTQYGDAIGLMFQVVDDLLDGESSSEVLGKTAGKDADRGKATFPRLMGSQAAHQYANELLERAEAALGPIHQSDSLLAAAAHYIRHRKH